LNSKDPWERTVSELLGSAVKRWSPLSGGCVGEVYRLDLEDGRALVAKVDSGEQPSLGIEGRMLTYLKERTSLPVPAVFHCSDSLLVMEFVESGGRGSPELHAGESLAKLHAVSNQEFGLEFDTLIGGLHQPNPLTSSWIEFFRRHRLEYMAGLAREAGRLPDSIWKRLLRLAESLEEWLEEPESPSLLHGDIWSGNVLTRGDRVAAFVDPAIYYGHPEIELAFITLFGTFGEAFFRRYQEDREIRPGFFERRRDLYNLYPLLVHVRLFGGGYLSGVESTLTGFGF
jgi:fructosamine-3-kinase